MKPGMGGGEEEKLAFMLLIGRVVRYNTVQRYYLCPIDGKIYKQLIIVYCSHLMEF